MDDQIEKIIYYNKVLQITDSINCYNTLIRNQNINSIVTENTFDKWNYYFSISNNKNQFSKGSDRLNTWLHLCHEIPILYFNKKVIPRTKKEIYLLTELINKLITIKNNNKFEYLFILSALIIIFQVFGDGNHRTSKYLMSLNDFNISQTQEEKINDILREKDYFVILNNPIEIMDNVINNLIKISDT